MSKEPFSQEIFLNHLAQTNPFPFLIPIEKAEGVYLYTPEGKRYLDLISGIAVANIGHGHPKVKEAIKTQVDKHLHVMAYGEFIQSPSNLLAKKLVDVLPPNLNCSYLVNSGTEANEGALKLAKRYTGRTEIISFHKSYHGSTHGSLSVSGNEKKKNAFRPLLPDVKFIRFNEIEDLQKITDFRKIVQIVNNEHPDYLYGIDDITPALLNATKILPLENIRDAHEYFFSKKILDKNFLTNKAINSKTIIFSHGASYPYLNINQLIVDEIFNKQQVLNSCKLLSSIPIKSEGVTNRINIFKCF